MIESVMFWNELNNPAHWRGAGGEHSPAPVEDPGCGLGLRMIANAARAARDRFPRIERVFPGMAPPEPEFIDRAAEREALEPFDALAGHNFWFDFGPASERGETGLDELDRAAGSLRERTAAHLGHALPIVASEIGVSSFAGDEAQAWAAERTLRALGALIDRLPDTRATWYSLFDLPEEYTVTSLFTPRSHGEVRHRKFGLYRAVDDTFRAKRAARAFARRGHPDSIGITQWFRMPWENADAGLTAERAHDISYRALEAAPPILRELQVQWLRINVTWCDWYCANTGELENGVQWFDDLIDALSEFRLMLTVYQTPPQLARHPEDYDTGSVPRTEDAGGFRDAILEILERYAPAAPAAR